MLSKLTAVAVLLAVPGAAAALGAHTQANYNDGKPGSAMQCRTFENDPQGARCARFCAELKDADKTHGTYCMCLPGPCPTAR